MVGSYETVFPYYASYINTELERPKFAHNDLLQLIFEFGVASILIFMVMLNVLNNKRKETIIIWAILLVSLFTYPFHVPTASFILLLWLVLLLGLPILGICGLIGDQFYLKGLKENNLNLILMPQIYSLSIKIF